MSDLVRQGKVRYLGICEAGATALAHQVRNSSAARGEQHAG